MPLDREWGIAKARAKALPASGLLRGVGRVWWFVGVVAQHGGQRQRHGAFAAAEPGLLAVPAAQLPAAQAVPSIALAIPQQYAALAAAGDKPATGGTEGDAGDAVPHFDAGAIVETTAAGLAMHRPAEGVGQLATRFMPLRRRQLDDLGRRSDRCVGEFGP